VGIIRGAIATPCTLCGALLGVHGGGRYPPMVAPLQGSGAASREKKKLDLILGGRTYLWFCAWISHMAFGPWYFVHPVKGTTVMF